jgi:hypothetical protein
MFTHICTYSCEAGLYRVPNKLITHCLNGAILWTRVRSPSVGLLIGSTASFLCPSDQISGQITTSSFPRLTLDSLSHVFLVSTWYMWNRSKLNSVFLQNLKIRHRLYRTSCPTLIPPASNFATYFRNILSNIILQSTSGWPSNLTLAITLLPWTREVPGSNLGRPTPTVLTHCGFSWVSSALQGN